VDGRKVVDGSGMVGRGTEADGRRVDADINGAGVWSA
jgi:hypothetical protein